MTLNVRSTLLSGGIALVAGTALALAAPLAASAHVHAHATSTAAGSTTVVSFTVPHGCDGSPTTVVTIDIPEGVLAVSPFVNAAWTVEAVLEGDPAAGVEPRVEQVVYTSVTGGLADGISDVLDVSLRLPDGAPGDVVAFPTTQTCVEGTAVWEGADAPSVTLTAATDAGDGHGHDSTDPEPDADHGETGGEEHTASADQSDVLARGLGIGGLVLGAAGLVVALLSRRGARS